MKITTFDPSIISPKADEVIKLFEDLGFNKTHNPTISSEIGDMDRTRMKNEGGFHVDISKTDKLPKDLMTIRMNVDNFDVAYDILLKHGFTHTKNGQVTTLRTAKYVTMVSPSGFYISIVQHMK